MIFLGTQNDVMTKFFKNFLPDQIKFCGAANWYDLDPYLLDTCIDCAQPAC